MKASTGISGLTVFAKRFKLQEKQNKCNEIFYTIKSVQAICAVVYIIYFAAKLNSLSVKNAAYSVSSTPFCSGKVYAILLKHSLFFIFTKTRLTEVFKKYIYNHCRK